MKIIILEDDPMIALDLKEICESWGARVIGVFHHPNEVMQYKGVQPDLALLDVHLNADQTGIEVARFLHDTKLCPHMFITSFFDERTVDAAAETAPLAYLLKPFQEEEVLTNLRLAARKMLQPEFSANHTHSLAHSKWVFVKTIKGLVRIDPQKVLYIEAEDVYTHLVMVGERLLTNHSLKFFASEFSSIGFCRVHRSYMVNLDRIDLIREDEIHVGEQRIPLGRTYKADFLQQIRVL